MSNADYYEDYDVITVETPENLLLRMPLAGFGPRMLAQLVDGLLLGLIAILLFIVVIVGSSIGAPNMDSEQAMLWPILIFVLAMMFFTVGYYILLEWLWNGQTVGKRMTGIRVVKRGGLPLSFADVLVRNLLRIVDNLPSYGLIGLISFFATRHQQRLGDLVADTIVIREFTSRLPYSWFETSSEHGRGEVGVLTPRMSYIIGSYLFRAGGLGIEYRLRLTDRIIRRLGYDPAPLSLRQRESYLASIMQMQLGVFS